MLLVMTLHRERTRSMDIKMTVCHPGGADSLQLAADAPAQPGAGEIRVRHDAIGVNFLDIYHRSGLYPLPEHGVPGVEAAGVVEALGAGVDGLVVGQRIAYAGAPVGAYRTTRLLPAARAIALPDAITSRVAAAAMLKGLTAHMLLTRTCAVQPGDLPGYFRTS
jgi:NADPH2:quinone reductase